MTLSVEASREAVSEMMRIATLKGCWEGEEEEDMLLLLLRDWE